MKVQVLALLFFFLIHEILSGQPGLERVVKQMLEQPEYKGAQAGFHISEMESGRVLFELNSDKKMIPASVLKLVTSAAALEILGPDYRFQTRIGYSGRIENGILKGNLVIIGGGDPALGSEYFRDHYFFPHFLEVWAKRIKAAGINRIEGNLVLDGSLYDTEKIPPTWVWEDMGNYYGAGASALTVYDNMFRISFRSPVEAGKPAEIISMQPLVEGLEWKSEVLSSDVNRDLAYVFGSPEDNRRVIRGTIPKNRKSFIIKASNPYPESLLANDFLNYLSMNGVFLTGQTVSDKVPAQHFRQVFLFESPPLPEIIRVLNVESVNLFAEHLVKQVAAEKTGVGSRSAGLQIISDYWQGKGLDAGNLFMEDGSGLSHFNAVTPGFISAVLSYMAGPGSSVPAFRTLLPSAGAGTLQSFNTRNFPANSLQVKSGSMMRTRCYAGYIKTAGGKDIIVVVFFNHFSGTHARLVSELEKLFVEIRNSN
jgi:serine-type D-Ala-D-Ala carboxypeptidase/endopeptidase (penicillin-binding protein 4)